MYHLWIMTTPDTDCTLIQGVKRSLCSSLAMSCTSFKIPVNTGLFRLKSNCFFLMSCATQNFRTLYYWFQCHFHLKNSHSYHVNIIHSTGKESTKVGSPLLLSFTKDCQLVQKLYGQEK